MVFFFEKIRSRNGNSFVLNGAIINTSNVGVETHIKIARVNLEGCEKKNLTTHRESNCHVFSQSRAARAAQ